MFLHLFEKCNSLSSGPSHVQLCHMRKSDRLSSVKCTREPGDAVN